MIRALRDRLNYSNVVASLALFVALGGGAYAVTKDSVKSKHIVNGEVKSSDLENDGIKGKDIKENELTNEDIDETTLYPAGGGPDGANTFTVPVSGAFSAQIRDIGGNGDDLFGGIDGRSVASLDFAEVATGTAFDTVQIGNMRVALAAPLGAGQSRTFTLVRTPSLGTIPLQTSLACTISEGESTCTANDSIQVTNPFIAIEIESSGAGLVSGQDAYIGAYVKQKADL
jgi:hypothetical protein